MKQTKFYQFVVLAGILLTALACTSQQEALNQNGFSLVKSPDFVAYSGEQTLGSTFSKTNRWKSSYMNANMYDQDWDCIPNVDLTADELEELKGILCKGEYTENTEIFPYTDYWVQQVYKGDTEYTPTDINGDPYNTSVNGSDKMELLKARNEHYEPQWVPENNYDGSEMFVEYEHINNFNYGNNTNNPGQCGCGIVHEGTTLMYDMSLDGITPNNQFAFHGSEDSRDYNNYIIVKYKGEWYVGFDYEMHKDTYNANEAKDIERDWCFTDWIVKITPAYHKGMTPEQPEDEQPEQPGDDDTEEPIEGYDEVEINLSVNDYKDYTATKLSMHLRSATDIEVFIPIPAEYYCQADDMAIVQQHLDDFMIHGGPDKLTYNINGYDVTLCVDYEANGIRVHTEGMCQGILDYCIEHFQDGLTFEVWNYFNSAVDRDFINEFLKENHATVEFLDKKPGQYINAFAQEGEDRFYYDNYVDIVEEQQDAFNAPRTGKHLNDSKYNEIYTNKGEE